MTLRSVAVRFVLIVAALTTVATSPPPEHVLSDVAQRILGAGPTRISVIANRAAVNHADRVELRLQLVPASGTAPTTVTIVPDDPSAPVEHVDVGAVPAVVEHDLTEVCMRDRDCDAGLTIEVPRGAMIDVTATASLIAFGDPSLFFPEDRSFPGDATVDVGFQP